MENKLSREDIVRVFFQYCPGAKVGITAEQFKHPVEVIGIEIMDIEQGRAVLKVIDNGIRLTYCINIGDVKLCLTPLSEISDEDAVEVSKLVYTGIEQDLIETGKRIVSRLINDTTCCEPVIEIIGFLRSKGYALPFRGVDLFEAGLAIKP